MDPIYFGNIPIYLTDMTKNFNNPLYATLINYEAMLDHVVSQNISGFNRKQSIIENIKKAHIFLRIVANCNNGQSFVASFAILVILC